MVNAVECNWTKKEAKALITFLLAEKQRHEKDIKEHPITSEKIRYHG